MTTADKLIAAASTLCLFYSGWLTLWPIFTRRPEDLARLATIVWSGFFWDVGPGSAFDHDAARRAARETTDAQFGFVFLYLGIFGSMMATLVRPGPCLSWWWLIVIPLAVAAEFFWIRPKRTSRLFDRTWLRWIEEKYLHPSEPKVPDTVGHIAFTNRHPDLEVFLGKHFGSRPWSSIGPNDYSAIEGWVVIFARRRGHKWRPEMQGWLQKVAARSGPSSQGP